MWCGTVGYGTVACTTNLESSTNPIQCCVIRPFGQKGFASSIRQIAMGRCGYSLCLRCRHKRNAAHYSMSGQLDSSRSHIHTHTQTHTHTYSDTQRHGVSKAICIMQTVWPRSSGIFGQKANFPCRVETGRVGESMQERERERAHHAHTCR